MYNAVRQSITSKDVFNPSNTHNKALAGSPPLRIDCTPKGGKV